MAIRKERTALRKGLYGAVTLVCLSLAPAAFAHGGMAGTHGTMMGNGPAPSSAGGYGPGMTPGGYGPGMMGNGYGPGMTGNGYGPGMAAGGYGPGAMMGYGPGMMGNGYGPGMMGNGYGPGMMGYGPGMMGYGAGMMGGYGPGMMGGYGPGMMGYGHMMYGGYGPGMMGYGPMMYGGYGYGPGRTRGYAQGPTGFAGLDLSDDQRQSLQELQQRQYSEQGPLRAKLYEQKARVQALMHADPVDPEAVRKAFDEMTATRRELMVDRAKMHNDFMKILTPEQRKAMQGGGAWPAGAVDDDADD